MTPEEESTALLKLQRLAKKITNDVINQAYSTVKPTANRGYMRDTLLINDTDSLLTVAVKQLTFFLGCGRLPFVPTEPDIPPYKRKSARPHGIVLFRPDDRRKYTDGTYDPNPRLRIPWMDYGKLDQLRGFGYKPGNFKVTYYLKDRDGLIVVNCISEAECKRVIVEIVECIYPARRMPGAVLENIVLTKRAANSENLILHDRKINAYAVDWRNAKNEMLGGRHQF